MKSIQNVLVILMASLALTGCSIEASMESISSLVPIKFPDFKAQGLISGSSQRGQTTDHAYYIQSSVGSFQSGTGEQKTTDSTYKVYSTVQGALISQ